MVAFIVATRPAGAATICGAGIELDGKHVAGYAETWVGQSPEELMGGLVGRKLTIERDFKVPVDADDPNKATLRGKIRVVASKRRDALLVAEFGVLHLVKRNGQWFVAEADVKKALAAAKAPAE